MIEPKHVSDESYCHAHKVFEENECKNLGDFTGTYCLGDTLQLVDCFEGLGTLALKNTD